jgi:hypothetical protein
VKSIWGVLHVIAVLYLLGLGLWLWSYPRISAACLLGAALGGWRVLDMAPELRFADVCRGLGSP